MALPMTPRRHTMRQLVGPPDILANNGVKPELRRPVSGVGHKAGDRAHRPCDHAAPSRYRWPISKMTMPNAPLGASGHADRFARDNPPPDLLWPDPLPPDLLWPDPLPPDPLRPDPLWPDPLWPDLLWPDLLPGGTADPEWLIAAVERTDGMVVHGSGEHSALIGNGRLRKCAALTDWFNRIAHIQGHRTTIWRLVGPATPRWSGDCRTR